ncbi:ABC transporter ATP-binding protein [candidate division KSB1 bacterium]|nr:ABC transporter ATP-binding protein [candidate division KSB1 bacterium]MBL7093661.1 ABC transporter ATP-binding protein [candidate division KSB1 bacterium]
MDALLKIQLLKTQFHKKHGIVKAVDGVDLKIHQGETLSLVGESGCGKSITGLSIMKLVPPPGRIVAGSIEFKKRNILNLSEKQMSKIRGKEIGLILQDPLSALNPVITVGEQISEVIRTHFPVNRKEAKNRTLDLMEKVQLPNVSSLYDSYPHQLSGGLRQRVLIAIALSCSPSLVIADEPTTALDVSIQSQILSLLKNLKKEFQISLLLITHDFSVVAEMADRVAVMYAGKIVEQANTFDIFTNPIHPYTKSLLDAIPKLDFSGKKKTKTIVPLKGAVPDMMNLPDGCTFYPRCSIADESCQKSYPKGFLSDGGKFVSCFKAKLA